MIADEFFKETRPQGHKFPKRPRQLESLEDLDDVLEICVNKNLIFFYAISIPSCDPDLYLPPLDEGLCHTSFTIQHNTAMHGRTRTSGVL